MAEDTLRKRYLYKLSSNLIGFIIGFIVQTIVPRELGPKSYGNFSFLTSIYSQIVLFFDLGNSSAFIVKVSQRPRETELVAFYLHFSCAGLFLFMISALVISIIPSFYQQIFPDQDVIYIVIAAFWAIFTRILQILNNMTDAYGLTVKSEKGIIIQRIIGLIIIAVLFLSHKLDLKNYFFYQFFITIFLSVIFIKLIGDSGFFKINNLKITLKKTREYFNEFYVYSYPMLIGMLVLFASGIIDRWLLQFWGGSVEQGFYGLSFQIGTISTLFTGAMSLLIMREFSIAFHQKDLTQMAYLFRRFIPLLYSLAAYFSCFIAVQSQKLINIIGGSQYNGAYMAVLIMSFYPLHQTYGQLSGSVLLATGQTRLYAKLGIFSVIIGLPMIYFLLSSKSNMGLNLGAFGLAIKMVILQFIFVNIQLYYNSSFLKLNFWKYIGHQFISVTCLLAISLLTLFIVDNGFGLQDKTIISFLISGLIYSIMVILMVYFLPNIFGLHQKDIKYIIQFVSRKCIDIKLQN